MQDLEHEFGGEPSEYYIWLHQMFYEDIEVTITFVGVHAHAKRRYQKSYFQGLHFAVAVRLYGYIFIMKDFTGLFCHYA